MKAFCCIFGLIAFFAVIIDVHALIFGIIVGIAAATVVRFCQWVDTWQG